jgi:tetratricopeptide (TPR) repeat protein
LNPTDIIIDHLGFAHASTQGAKVDRNLRLIKMDLQEHPHDSFVLYNLGAAHLSRHQYREALEPLELSLQHSGPGDSLVPKLFGLLVRVHQQLDNREGAWQVCRQGRLAHPLDPELLFWEAVLAREQKDLPVAERALLQLLRLTPRRHFSGIDDGLYGYRTRHMLGQVYLEQKRPAEAEIQWRKAVRACPSFMPAWLELAYLCLEQGRWSELDEVLGQLRRDPLLVEEALVLEGRGLLEQRNFEAAKTLLAREITERPGSLPLRVLLSHVLLQEGKDWAAAENALRAVLELDPGHQEAQHNLKALAQRPTRGPAATDANRPATPAAAASSSATCPRVSLCMIVRNEEENLPACLISVADLVHEIIIVDTGSTDRTKEVAAQFGARIVDFVWVDNFAAARNESLRHARGEWILWMDADDRLDDHNRERLRQLFARLADENAAYAMKCLCLPNPVTGRATQVDHVRLFRNDPRLRWCYRVHEQILPALVEAVSDIRWSNVVIRHTGYQDPALRARKLERDLRLLRIELEEHPEDPFVLFNLGAVYREQGRLAEAIPFFRRSLERSEPRASIVPKLYALLAQSYHQVGDIEQALEAVRQGRSLYPTDVELLFQEGVIQKERGDLAGAEKSWRAALSTAPSPHFGSVDVGLRGHLTCHNLAVLCEQQGRRAEAEKFWRLALDDRPGYEPALLGLAEAGLRGQRWQELARLLQEIEAMPSLHLDAEVMRARVHMARKEFDRALPLLHEAIAQQPKALWPRVVLTHALLQEGRDWVAAEGALREVLRMDPHHGEARKNLSLLLRRTGRSGSDAS